ncbi:MAG: primosomal protein N', partial [bacterium]
MIAKGLDFPKVTLVGVISADTGLYLPDFRATERTFQLLTQVAGRAGRKGGQGEVIIQTYSDRHYCLQCTKKHDFKQFFYNELADRHTLNYPPFGRLALLQMKHKDEKKAWQAALHLASLLKAMDKTYEILGPAPAPLAKLQQYYRFQIILKNNRKHDPAAKRMRAAIKKAVETYRKESRHGAVSLTIDIDPMAIL